MGGFTRACSGVTRGPSQVADVRTAKTVSAAPSWRRRSTARRLDRHIAANDRRERMPAERADDGQRSGPYDVRNRDKMVYDHVSWLNGR